MPNTPRNQIPYPAGADAPSGPTHLSALALAIDDHIKDLSDTLALRPAASMAGRFYFAIDKGVVYRDTGTAWQAVHNIPLITSWPPPAALAVDGMILDYNVTGAEIWRLRYRAASASPYKWEVISAHPRFNNVDTDQTTSSITYTDLATLGPDVTVPLEGDYFVEIGCNQYHLDPGGAPALTTYMSFATGAVAASDNDKVMASLGRPNNTDFAHFSCTRCVRKDAIPASSLLRAKYKMAATTAPGHWRWRWMRVRPIRVI